VLVSNNSYRLGRAIGSGTRPRIDKGELGITVIGKFSWQDVNGPSLQRRGGHGRHRPSWSTRRNPFGPAWTARRSDWTRR
jgi:hypothetical protein